MTDTYPVLDQPNPPDESWVATLRHLMGECEGGSLVPQHGHTPGTSTEHLTTCLNVAPPPGDGGQGEDDFSLFSATYPPIDEPVPPDATWLATLRHLMGEGEAGSFVSEHGPGPETATEHSNTHLGVAPPPSDLEPEEDDFFFYSTIILPMDETAPPDAWWNGFPDKTMGNWAVAIPLPKNTQRPGTLKEHSTNSAGMVPQRGDFGSLEDHAPPSAPTSSASTEPGQPESSPLEAPSIGSLKHGLGECKPCAYFLRTRGCVNKVACRHCHLCGFGAARRLSRARRAALRRLAREGPSSVQ